METILLGVTVLSLLVAAIMSVASWRMARAERERSAARVAALVAAASTSEDPAQSAQVQSAPVEPARPQPAPVHALPVHTAPIHAEAPHVEIRPEPVAARVSPFPPARAASAAARVPDLTLNAASDAELPLRTQSPIAGTFLGVARPPEHSAGRQRVLVVAAAVLFVVLAGGAYLSLSGHGGAAGGATAAASAATAPLELISLRHERHGAHLTLSGLVHNPAAGAPIENLAAVVFLFDAQGGFLSSARTGVDFKHLAPGDESPFEIGVDAPANVARYRVSFRTDAGVVAHVDRRGEQSVATAIVR